MKSIARVRMSYQERSICRDPWDRLASLRASALRSLPTLIVMVLALCSAAMADVTATVSGVVQDSTGAVLPGALILATNIETGIRTTVTTDTKGFCSLPALPIGTYNISVTKSGFKSY